MTDITGTITPDSPIQGTVTTSETTGVVTSAADIAGAITDGATITGIVEGDTIIGVLTSGSTLNGVVSAASPITGEVAAGGIGSGVSDHGALTGLGDDDHTQYLLASDATSRAAFATNWTDLTDSGATTLHTHAGEVTNGDSHDHSGGDGAQIDHGGLAGLSDDDHPQYIKDSEFTQDGGVLVGTGAGTFQEETGATLRTSLGLAIGTDVLAPNGDGSSLTGIDYSVVSGNDGATDVTAAQLEELTDGSTTTLHNHAGTGQYRIHATIDDPGNGFAFASLDSGETPALTLESLE